MPRGQVRFSGSAIFTDMRPMFCISISTTSLSCKGPRPSWFVPHAMTSPEFKVIMVVANSNYKENAEEFIDIIKNEFGIELNCGIGTGKTARDAVKLATKSLDTIREIRDAGKDKPEIYEIV